MLRVVFMGSPDFAAPCLRALLGAHDVRLVITKPDKPAGRGKKTVSPVIKDIAVDAEVQVIQPSSARDPEVVQAIKDSQAEIGVVVAYGKILPPAVLEAFPLGCINVHASLLPAYRGAAPIQWAVINGELETGVSIMQLDEGMDTGPVFLTRSISLAENETAGSLFERLAPLGANALVEALGSIEVRSVNAVPQCHEVATYAPMLKKSDGVIDWSQDGGRVAGRIRGVDPWPGAVAELDGLRVKLFDAVDQPGSGVAGEVLRADAAGLLVACGSGAVLIRAVQAPGRKRLPVGEFIRGRAIAPGTRFGRIE